MNLFDTHAHFSGDRDKVRETLDHAFRAGVSNLMAVGGSPELNSAALLAAEAATVRPY